jgi:hypothetical protein
MTERPELVALVDARMEGARRALELDKQGKTLEEQQERNRRLIEALGKAGVGVTRLARESSRPCATCSSRRAAPISRPRRSRSYGNCVAT